VMCATVTECPTPLDIVFLVDDSSSILPAEWPNVLQFLSGVTGLLYVNNTHTRVGIVQYATTANVLYRLTDLQSRSAVQRAIGRMQHQGGRTNLAAAMRLAFRDVFLTSQRPGAAKVGRVLFRFTLYYS